MLNISFPQVEIELTTYQPGFYSTTVTTKALLQQRLLYLILFSRLKKFKSSTTFSLHKTPVFNAKVKHIIIEINIKQPSKSSFV